jgi:hypothetical protein
LNAANARNFDLSFSDRRPFFAIALSMSKKFEQSTTSNCIALIPAADPLFADNSSRDFPFHPLVSRRSPRLN